MNFNDFKGLEKNNQNPNGEAKKMLMDFLSSYNGKSEDEIIDTIMKTAKERRENGKLSDSEIDSFYQSLSPVLNASQRKKLDDVVKKLKEI